MTTSCVHFFTSHFYTTLQDEGVDAVSSWTTNKGIDIFSKRIIFLPINESIHWSLCAVVNPGLIKNYFRITNKSSVSQMNSAPVVCSFPFFGLLSNISFLNLLY